MPRTARVDLPPGLWINPNASEKCSLAEFEHTVPGEGSQDPLTRPGPLFRPECGPGSKVGEVAVKVVNEEEESATGFFVGEVIKLFAPQVALFDLQPKPGEPGLFGFVLPGEDHLIYLRREIAWDGDFHESFTIEGLRDYRDLVFGYGQRLPVAIHTMRISAFGEAGDGTLATNPTTCFNADEPQFAHLYSSWARVDSFG